MKYKYILFILLGFLLLGADSCPTAPEEKPESIGTPPAFPEVPAEE